MASSLTAERASDASALCEPQRMSRARDAVCAAEVQLEPPTHAQERRAINSGKVPSARSACKRAEHVRPRNDKVRTHARSSGNSSGSSVKQRAAKPRAAGAHSSACATAHPMGHASVLASVSGFSDDTRRGQAAHGGEEGRAGLSATEVVDGRRPDLHRAEDEAETIDRTSHAAHGPRTRNYGEPAVSSICTNGHEPLRVGDLHHIAAHHRPVSAARRLSPEESDRSCAPSAAARSCRTVPMPSVSTNRAAKPQPQRAATASADRRGHVRRVPQRADCNTANGVTANRGLSPKAEVVNRGKSARSAHVAAADVPCVSAAPKSEATLDVALLDLLNGADSAWSASAHARSTEQRSVALSHDPMRTNGAADAPHFDPTQQSMDTRGAHATGIAAADGSGCAVDGDSCCDSRNGTAPTALDVLSVLQLEPTVGVIAKALADALCVRSTETSLHASIGVVREHAHALDASELPGQLTVGSLRAAADHSAHVEVRHPEMLADLHCKHKLAAAQQLAAPRPVAPNACDPNGASRPETMRSDVPPPERATETCTDPLMPVDYTCDQATADGTTLESLTANRSGSFSSRSHSPRSMCADGLFPTRVEQLPGRLRSTHQAQLLALLRTDSTVIRQRITTSE